MRIRPPRAAACTGWRMGRLSYELYLSHMFVVLATVGAYRALLGATQAWNFAVYVPVVVCCYYLARLLEQRVSVKAAAWIGR